MQFIDRITVKRSHRHPDSFCRSWDSYEAALKLSPWNPPRTFVEYLSCPDGDASRATPGKMYLDRDVYVGNEAPSQELIDDHLGQVRSNVQVLVDRMTTERNNLTFVVATRHGYCTSRQQHKLSFRPFIQGMSIRYTDIPRVIRLMDQEDFWDMSVYKASEQLLAAINCCKGQIGKVLDSRVLRPEPGAEDPLLYVAQHVHPDWEHLDLPQDYYSEDAPSQENDEREVGGCVDPVFVSDLVACLGSATSDDRKRWLSVAIVLKALGAGGDMFLGDWIEFSRRGTKFISQEDCQQTWSNLNVDGSARTGQKSCGLGSLRFFARADNQELYLSACQSHRSRSGADTDSPNTIRADCSKLSIQAVQRAVDAVISRLGMTHVDVDSWELSKQGTKLRLDVIASLGGLVPGPMHVELDITTLKLYVNGGDAGYMHDKEGIPVSYSLTKFHDGFDDSMAWTASRPTDGTVRFLSDARGASISASNFDRPATEMSARVTVLGGRNTNKYSVKDMRLLQIAHDSAVQNAVLTQLGLGTVFAIVQNGTNNNLTINMEGSTKDFALIRDKLLNYAESKGLRKRAGYIYQPVEGCLCAFTQRCTYDKLINEALKDNETYNNNPKRFDEVLKYLQNYELTKLPQLEPDYDLVSFSNGVLQLSTHAFQLYSAIDSDAEHRVARHHIPLPYDQDPGTPLLNQILDSQFERGVSEILCALIGRMLFDVNSLDGWQVMPYLVGIGGTGKSLIMNIIQNLFAPGTVGNLASKREEIFGMANLIDKEIVMGRDMPAKLSGAVPQETMQAMTAGDGMEVPRKGLAAVNITWKAPCIMASNHMPDYANTGNNIGRRIVTFRFERTISDPQDDLLQRIVSTELPSIVCRCLLAYSNLRARVAQAKGFWKAMPPTMIEWQNKLAAATSKLHEFLNMDDEERGCSITRTDGHVTSLLEFKAYYEAKMGKGTFVNDPAVFTTFNIRISDSREQVCASCKQQAKKHGGPCCAAYNHETRGKKFIMYDLEMASTRLQLGP